MYKRQVGFTIQGAKFVIENQDDVNISPTELVWKDTVWVKKKVDVYKRQPITTF